MPHAVDVHVGTMIRQRRWFLGVTQESLANAVGIKFQQIQKYETGANRVSASRLWDIAAALDVPVEYFYEGLTGKAKSVEVDKGAVEVMNAYMAVDQHKRRSLLGIARALVGTQAAA